MRTVTEIDNDIAALKRPPFPGMVGATHPAIYEAFKLDRDAWAAATPGIAQRYESLLAERDRAELEERALKKAHDALSDANVPGLVRKALVTPVRKPAFDACDQWVAGESPWLLLVGPTGTGKSVAAGYALQRQIRAGRKGVWMGAVNFTTVVGGFNGAAECERIKHLDALVIDDYGTEHLNSFAESVFYEVLAHRHEEGRATVLTSNLASDVLRQRLGSRLYDRISNDCVFVRCEGESMRRKPPEAA